MDPEIDPEVAEIIAEDTDRGVLLDHQVYPLTIIDARGEPRWESDRFHQEPPAVRRLDKMADQYIQHLEDSDADGATVDNNP